MCRPEAAPAAVITWYKDGILLNPGGAEADRVRQLPNGHLFIKGLTENDQGNYSCEAQNVHGKAMSSGLLTVLSKSFIYIEILENTFSKGIYQSAQNQSCCQM